MSEAGTSSLETSPRRQRAVALWGAAVSAGLVTGLLLRVRTNPDADLWLHLRLGDLLRAGQRFGSGADPLAALADRRYVPSQWVAQVAMSAVYEMAGMTGIQVVRLVLVLALGAVVLVGCRLTAAPAPALFATAMTMFGAAAAWGERPQLAGMALLALTVALWWRAIERRAVPWAVVPLTWMWTMIHGTWLVGVAIGLVFVIGGTLDRCWRGHTLVQAALVPTVSVGAALLTPLGTDALLEPFRVSSVARLTANEWQRPALGNPLLLVVLASTVVALLGLVRSTHRRWTRILTLLAGVVLAVWMVRTIAAGAVVLAPVLAQGLASVGRRPSRQPTGECIGSRRADPAATTASREWAAWGLAAAIVLVLGGSHIATTTFDPPVSERVSTALAALPRDAVLAADGRGVGWVQWAHRDRRPLRDLRAEVYSMPVASAYEDFQQARRGWQRYAETQRITAVLADRQEPLDRALSREPAWATVAEDPDFRLWVHR